MDEKNFTRFVFALQNVILEYKAGLPDIFRAMSRMEATNGGRSQKNFGGPAVEPNDEKNRRELQESLRGQK